VAWRQATTLLAHPDFEIVDEPLCSLLTDGNTFCGCLAVDGPLDLEQFVDPAHRFRGDGRLRQGREIEELPAAMAPGRCFVDWCGRIETPIPAACMLDFMLTLSRLPKTPGAGCNELPNVVMNGYT
jgi:hypothetical protein